MKNKRLFWRKLWAIEFYVKAADATFYPSSVWANKYFTVRYDDEPMRTLLFNSRRGAREFAKRFANNQRLSCRVIRVIETVTKI